MTLDTKQHYLKQCNMMVNFKKENGDRKGKVCKQVRDVKNMKKVGDQKVW